MDKILDTIKKTIGVSVEDTSFDIDLMLFINSNLSVLSQIGITEADKTPIINDTTTWFDLIGDREDLEMVKTFLHFKTKLMFDPPTNSAMATSIEKIITEIEWRLANLQVNKGGDTNV